MWAIDDGRDSVHTMLYVPDEPYITRRIAFVRRATVPYRGLITGSRIE